MDWPRLGPLSSLDPRIIGGGVPEPGGIEAHYTLLKTEPRGGGEAMLLWATRRRRDVGMLTKGGTGKDAASSQVPRGRLHHQ